MPVNVDLHTHSDQSDGVLSPLALAQRVHEYGVTMWSLTDHDELSGLPPARAAAAQLGLQFISGVEISASFCGRTVHIVGLGFDADNHDLQNGLAQIRASRLARAKLIAQSLEQLGIPDAMAGALQYVSNPRLIGRVHFAKHILQLGLCNSLQQVFDKYLGENKPAFVPMQWVSLDQAVSWIKNAGGKAVIAHPARYNYKKQQLTALFDTFKDSGGDAIEVITCSHTSDEIDKFARLALVFGFQASRGSDFHAPGASRIDIGQMPELPSYLVPVWQDWI